MVLPHAEAGIETISAEETWIPACAGMTAWYDQPKQPRCYHSIASHPNSSEFDRLPRGYYYEPSAGPAPSMYFAAIRS
jgi:hypothetical protein